MSKSTATKQTRKAPSFTRNLTIAAKHQNLDQKNKPTKAKTKTQNQMQNKQSKARQRTEIVKFQETILTKQITQSIKTHQMPP